MNSICGLHRNALLVSATPIEVTVQPPVLLLQMQSSAEVLEPVIFTPPAPTTPWVETSKIKEEMGALEIFKANITAQ